MCVLQWSVGYPRWWILLIIVTAVLRRFQQPSQGSKCQSGEQQKSSRRAAEENRCRWLIRNRSKTSIQVDLLLTAGYCSHLERNCDDFSNSPILPSPRRACKLQHGWLLNYDVSDRGDRVWPTTELRCEGHRNRYFVRLNMFTGTRGSMYVVGTYKYQRVGKCLLAHQRGNNSSDILQSRISCLPLLATPMSLLPLAPIGSQKKSTKLRIFGSTRVRHKVPNTMDTFTVGEKMQAKKHLQAI